MLRGFCYSLTNIFNIAEIIVFKSITLIFDTIFKEKFRNIICIFSIISYG